MVEIVDTTLRDGEQQAGIALCVEEKVMIAKILNEAGVYQIEAGVPAMGGDEKKSIQKIVQLSRKSRVSTWNRLNTEDIKHSIECEPDIIHISVPVSDIHIRAKLGRDRTWIIDNLKRCICFASDRGYRVSVGLEDASRADSRFLLRIAAIALLEGAERIRYADTVGILNRQKVYNDIYGIKSQISVGIEFHAHNDLGMAVANSISAVQAGADYIDCTIGGIGERAGNCNYIEFVKSARECLDIWKDINMPNIVQCHRDIMKIICKKQYAV
jgi:homocitrate synthase NifV